MKIHIIRHTTPAIAEGICYGQTDLDLADSFEAEKEIIHNKLQMPYDVVITSPLQRCSKLANTIDTAEYRVDERLMEYNFGDWEMRPWAEFKSDADQQWMDNFVDIAAPNGDSIVSMRERVLQFWDELLQRPFSKVALVSHSGVQRLIHANVLETPLNRLFRLQLDYGAVMQVEHDRDSQMTTIKHL